MKDEMMKSTGDATGAGAPASNTFTGDAASRMGRLIISNLLRIRAMESPNASEQFPIDSVLSKPVKPSQTILVGVGFYAKSPNLFNMNNMDKKQRLGPLGRVQCREKVVFPTEKFLLNR